MTTQKASRNWCLTWNNYTDENILYLETYKHTYLIYGKEIGKECKTPHLQIYMEFKSAMLFTTIKKAFPSCHIEPRFGTQLQAITYSKKDGLFIEKGESKSQGVRTDLQMLAEAIINKEYTPNMFGSETIRYSKGISVLIEAQKKHRTEAPIVIWRWGKAGTGKTKEPYEKHIDSVYIKDGTAWWDNYNQEEAIIIDDFCARAWPFRDLLRLLDRYPYQGQYKGGYHKINSPYIYITCEYHPSSFWKDNELLQITRRIKEIIEIKTQDTTEVVGNTILPLNNFEKSSINIEKFLEQEETIDEEDYLFSILNKNCYI